MIDTVESFILNYLLQPSGYQEIRFDHDSGREGITAVFYCVPI